MRQLFFFAAAIGLLSLSSHAQADDPFMAIHMENQKIGSAVSIYWQFRTVLGHEPAFLAYIPEAKIDQVWADVNGLAQAIATSRACDVEAGT
jgi:hypothetical protein